MRVAMPRSRAGSIQMRRRVTASSRASVMLRRTGWVSSSPCRLPILRHEAHPRADAIARLPCRDRPAVDQDAARVRPIGGEDGAQQLGPARSHQAGNAEDLAATHLEGDVDGPRCRASGLRPEAPGRRSFWLAHGSVVQRVAADHQLNRPLDRQLGDRTGLDQRGRPAAR